VQVLEHDQRRLRACRVLDDPRQRLEQPRVVGGTKSASGVWASDHAGVMATVEVR
jgi:hypothetical protein